MDDGPLPVLVAPPICAGSWLASDLLPEKILFQRISLKSGRNN
jgi:hypothetical protein